MSSRLDDSRIGGRVGRRPPKYDDLTKRYAAFLFPLVDRYDWGYTASTGDVKHVNPIWALAFDGRVHPERLTKTFLQAHLRRHERLHYKPTIKSGVAFVFIDVDAHRGQQDALETSLWIRTKYCTGGYLEPSKRGYHLYLKLAVGNMTARAFNKFLDDLADDLQTAIKEYGFASDVEVKPRFNCEERGQLGAAPYLHNGDKSLDELISMPVIGIDDFRQLREDAEVIREFNRSDISTSVNRTQSSVLTIRRYGSLDAWERMVSACWDYTEVYRCLPDESGLLEHYAGLFPECGSSDDARIKRARSAIAYRARTFDPALAAERGYSGVKSQLLEAISAHVTDKSSKYRCNITDEDLAIGLYVVQRKSFTIADNPRHQWTCGYDCFAAMAQKLHDEGLTNRKFGMRAKISAVKQILERAGLIECLDRRYIPAGGQQGVSQKWTIGPNHPRYAEFVRFAENVKVQYVREPSPMSIVPTESRPMALAA